MSKETQSAASPQTVSEQIHADHLIIVTNRGPVEYYMDQDKTLRYRRGEGAIPISPADMVETAEALYKALTLSPEERRQKAELARQIVEHHDLKTWIAQQVRDISSLIAK